jgi:hypothetical protein
VVLRGWEGKRMEGRRDGRVRVSMDVRVERFRRVL